ncbi:MAG: LOG family protein [Chloroflexales bacterium]|nr:LOG family protein [Chloroflexales bacterium]
MGTLARSALDHGGIVVGIIPQSSLDREQGLVEASDLIVTDTLRQHKALMGEYAPAFVALEETIETLTLRQLSYHSKLIIFVTLGDYYDPLFALFEHAVGQGYIAAEHTRLYDIFNSVDEAIALLEHMSCEDSACRRVVYNDKEYLLLKR